MKQVFTPHLLNYSFFLSQFSLKRRSIFIDLLKKGPPPLKSIFSMFQTILSKKKLVPTCTFFFLDLGKIFDFFLPLRGKKKNEEGGKKHSQFFLIWWSRGHYVRRHLCWYQPMGYLREQSKQTSRDRTSQRLF